MGSFILSLAPEDLQRLRAIVRATWLKYYPTEHQTDAEIDRIIEHRGAEASERLLRRAIDAKLFGIRSQIGG